jgi:pSer/pThr/pTyr-binding forkhead associated (FHA) protein
MSDSVLTILKFCLLALLYVFLLRVVLVVARELRGTPEPVAVPIAPPGPPPRPARGAKRQWKLVVVEPPAERGKAFMVNGEATIGRGGGCNVPLSFDTFASQVHARAQDREGKLWIEDVGSTNGTIVNGARIDAPRQLGKGDRVQIGETLLEVDR